MFIYNKFKVISVFNCFNEPEINIIAIGLILENGKVRLSYLPIGEYDDDEYNNYNELIDILPNNCYIEFDE